MLARAMPTTTAPSPTRSLGAHSSARLVTELRQAHAVNAEIVRDPDEVGRSTGGEEGGGDI
jgi:hypothetical protein